jgi:hypothetical protein
MEFLRCAIVCTARVYECRQRVLNFWYNAECVFEYVNMYMHVTRHLRFVALYNVQTYECILMNAVRVCLYFCAHACI